MKEILPDWKALVSGKFKTDLAWNFLSFGVMAAGGVLLNIIIALFYEPADLGVFNQAYAVYMFASQLAVLGIPLSVLRHVSEHWEDGEACGAIIVSAFLLTGVNASVVTGALWFGRHTVAGLLDSAPLAPALSWVAPGLFFFALNKVSLSAFNGSRRMKLLAALQGLRALLMTAILLALALSGRPGHSLTVLFPITETIIFIITLFFIGGRALAPAVKAIKPWLSKHLEFGIKSSISGVLLQLNTRVDVLMLGYFSGDAVVGIYSFSAILAEGFYQLAMVVNRNVTPLLVLDIAAKRFTRLRDFIKKGKKLSFLFMASIGGVLVLAYPVGLRLMGKGAQYRDGWAVFAILVLGIAAASAYLPFRTILLAADLPGWHTVMVTILVGTNLLLNAILIPHWGMTGAAAATAAAMASLVFWLKMIARWKFKTGEETPAPLI